jgi:hypothetical protein
MKLRIFNKIDSLTTTQIRRNMCSILHKLGLKYAVQY